jgi:hypothetical protein
MILTISIIVGPLITSCNLQGTNDPGDNGEYFVEGTIDSTVYRKEYTSGYVAVGWIQVHGASNQSDFTNNQNKWSILVYDTTTGTYNSLMESVSYVVNDTTTYYYSQGPDITIYIDVLTSDVIEGRFEGTLTYNEDSSTHTVNGTFKVPRQI